MPEMPDQEAGVGGDFGCWIALSRTVKCVIGTPGASPWLSPLTVLKIQPKIFAYRVWPSRTTKLVFPKSRLHRNRATTCNEEFTVSPKTIPSPASGCGLLHCR